MPYVVLGVVCAREPDCAVRFTDAVALLVTSSKCLVRKTHTEELL